MDLLLDTHVFLWWDAGADPISPAVRAAIADPDNRVYVSAASVWEIAIKAGKGKLAFSGSPSSAIAQNAFLPLPMTPEHAERAGGLDWAHPDPFDRMLVAQAEKESLTLVHADGVIADYKGVAQLWARA
ncbi:type II toxin-antitoxin system VapC family toxin [Azospirillum canadense]|uniref:type II toxin-antitoxin system VapC family toxin n=1 Tax=Azospirillum canadense TaxID=403962 RepID=UPI002226EF27|nr:type II toxin-antitoxin system VapC family toxin [Azospirillum canadense]MCW2239091.1 PIN domain nuclease of toxin-antitoxin system [Azospirillum canadense]MCW2241782.1 PIN domain nuclease of toxin-antitoxin system [Azospirillum canadense]